MITPDDVSEYFRVCFKPLGAQAAMTHEVLTGYGYSRLVSRLHWSGPPRVVYRRPPGVSPVEMVDTLRSAGLRPRTCVGWETLQVPNLPAGIYVVDDDLKAAFVVVVDEGPWPR